MPITSTTIPASQDPTHPDHHSELGKILASVVLGVTAASAIAQGPVAFVESPQLAQIIAGFVSIWTAPKN